jgi:invasion protein IalB
MQTLRLHVSAVTLACMLGTPLAAQDLGAPAGEEAPGFGVLPQATGNEEAPATGAEAGDPAGVTDAEETAAPDASDAEEDAEPEDAAGEAADLPGDALGIPAIEAAEVIRDTFEDWEVRCLADGNECFLYQLALDADGNPVAEFSLIRLPDGGEAVAGATVVTPLGTLLPAGLLMQIDSGEVRQYPFTFCNQVGCFAQLALTQAQVSALQRGRVARLGVTSIAAPEDPVELDLSLMGFTAAFRSLEEGGE